MSAAFFCTSGMASERDNAALLNSTCRSSTVQSYQARQENKSEQPNPQPTF